MECPRCHAPSTDEILQEFGGVCPKCLLTFVGEKDAPSFPNLEIVEMIGQGGMGVVYKAVQTNLNRTVALKVLSPKLSDDPEFLGRFTREAQALAQLSHPNIVAIHDSGVHDRVPYLVMEFVEGRSLRALLQSKEITVAQVLDLIPQICDALQYAHSKGVVHRDIKPENILVDAAGRVKIADYGLAKLSSAEDFRLTKTGFVMGTPHYMAPEQIENSSQVDHRADIYSLGVIFYEMLTGELPLGRFKPPSARGLGDRRLDQVVLKTLEREPSDRTQSAGEVREQITRLKKAPAPFRSRTGYVPPPPPSKLKTAAFILANLSGIFLIAQMTLPMVWGPAEFAGKIGAVLFLGALVLGMAAIIRHGFRQALAGRMRWIVIFVILGAIVVVAMLDHPSSSRPSPLHEPPRIVPVAEPARREILRSWSRKIPVAPPYLGLLAGRPCLVAASASAIAMIDPYSGHTLSRWEGTVDALPVLVDPEIVLWGAGYLTVLDTSGERLTLKARSVIPCPGRIIGSAIRRNVLYAMTDQRAIFAYNFVLHDVEWTHEDLPFTPIGEPIVTDMSIVLFNRSSQRLFLSLDSGATKSQDVARGGGAGDRVSQWETGWASLLFSDDRFEFNTYSKGNLTSMSVHQGLKVSAPSQCYLAASPDVQVATVGNHIYAIPTKPRRGASWDSVLPPTAGAPAIIGQDLIAIPTAQGVLFHEAQTGARIRMSIPADPEDPLAPGDDLKVVGTEDWLVILHPKTGQCFGYRISPKD